MADTVAQVADVVRLLREWGYTVVEVDGWEDRGREPMTTQGRCEHHTAGGSGNAPSLRVVTFGRKGLRNSLSRWFVARDGTIYLVARKTSWHAGRGSKGSNSTLSGTESEHSGSPDEPWSEASLDAQAAISAAESAVFGVDPGRVWDHREHAPRRKPDRVNVDSPRWRDRVRRLVDDGRPEPEPDERWADHMIRIWHGRDTDDRSEPAWWLVVLSDLEYRLLGSAETIDTWTRRVESDGDPDVIGHSAPVDKARPSWFAGLDRVG